ncbi:EamA family transporter RarD [Nocardioides sp. DS6]|uniref:EamA family transporter RarD n=1 Tax=Nocardioides eburneus TaxID=3231482 RepID=A0ABV3SWT8_9ACTN
MPDQRRGVMLGAAAYVMWGFFPLYFPLLEPAGAFEILGHRLLWSLVVMAVVVVAMRRLPQVLALVRDRRRFGLLVVAGIAVTANWATYIWGVNHGRVVETSLGYFINPLVTMLMGVLILGERLRRLQWAALGIGAVAVAVLTVDYGRLPWISLILAFSFGSYGLAKKKAGAGAFESLALETSVVAPVALAYVVGLGTTGHGHFTTEGPAHVVLTIGSGLVTVVPLLCFGAAATRVPLVTLGLLQYLAPILQFALGVFYRHEEMSAGRWLGFVIVWVALVVFTYEAVAHRRRQLRDAVEAAAV